MSDTPKPAPPRPAAPAGLYPEPSPALKNVLGLRAESELAEAWVEAINEVARQAQERKNAKAPLAEWIPLYERSREILSRVQEDLDRKIQEIKLAAPDELSRIPQRLVGEPKKEAEAVRARVKAEIKRVSGDWWARVQRMLEHHIREPAVQNLLSGLEIAEDRSQVPAKFSVEAAWVERFADYLRKAASSWGSQIQGDLERDLAGAVLEAGHLGLAGKRPVSAPRSMEPPEPEVRMFTAPEPKQVHLPNKLELMMKGLRGGMMLARFIGGFITLIGTGGLAALAIFFEDNAGIKTLLGSAAALVVMVALPFMIWTAWEGARREGVAIEERERVAYRHSIERWIRDNTDRILDRHRERMQRFVQARGGDWEVAVDGWWDQAVAPALAELEQEANRQVERARESQSQAQNELNQLRTLRTQVVGYLKAIKIRNQEILDES
jgi:hypothetical protein